MTDQDVSQKLPGSNLSFKRMPLSRSLAAPLRTAKYVYLGGFGARTKVGVSENPRFRLNHISKAIGMPMDHAYVAGPFWKAESLERAIRALFRKSDVNADWVSVPVENVKNAASALIVSERHIKAPMSYAPDTDALLIKLLKHFNMPSDWVSRQNL